MSFESRLLFLFILAKCSLSIFFQYYKMDFLSGRNNMQWVFLFVFFLAKFQEYFESVG